MATAIDQPKFGSWSGKPARSRLFERPKSFTFDTLDTHRQVIRLFKIVGQGDGSIQGLLEQHELMGAPKFRALSYTWGSGASTGDLTICGQNLVIRSNLFDFLEAYGSKHRMEYIWIDQICIDQSSNAERNHQVLLMSKIYHRASEVLIWLGRGEEDCTINACSRDCIELHDESTIDDCSWLNGLLDNEYWSRVWILQEVLLAKFRRIWYGHSTLEWPTVHDAIRRRGNAPAQLNFLNRSIFRGFRHSIDDFNLLDALAHCAASKCQDPRDKIYGLQGLLREEQRLPVDYDMAVNEVWLESASMLVYTSWMSIRKKPPDEQRADEYYAVETITKLAAQMNVEISPAQHSFRYFEIIALCAVRDTRFQQLRRLKNIISEDYGLRSAEIARPIEPDKFTDTIRAELFAVRQTVRLVPMSSPEHLVAFLVLQNNDDMARFRNGEMKDLETVLLIINLAFQSVASEAIGSKAAEHVFAACRLALAANHFLVNGTQAAKLVETCQNHDRINSLYLCLRQYGVSSEISTGLQEQNQTCKTYTRTWLPPLSIVANITGADIERLRHISVDDRSKAIQLNETVMVDARLYAAAFNTLDAEAYAHRHHIRYGMAVMVFWFSVITFALLFRLIVFGNRRSRLSQGSRSSTSKALLATRNFLKQWLTVPATFGYRCSQNLGWCTIPPRIQSLTILSFVLVNFHFCISGYRIVPDNLYFPGTIRQLLRYVSDRTGIISFANFPLIWLFGMRNNLLLWLTGWDFGTYNNFHRWVARVATLQAVIHSIGYTALVYLEGGWSYFVMWWSFMFWWTGELATIFMCLILVLSVFWMRRKHYETFLIVHIVFSILVLVTMLGHVSIFRGRFNIFIWAPLAVWALDRLSRVTKTMLFNRKFWNNMALATYDSNSNVVRLMVPNEQSIYQPKPGTFYYLHVLDDLRFWESHPFTMAYSLRSSRSAIDDASERLPLLRESETVELIKNKRMSTSMTFLIRPYDSFTRRLRNTASARYPNSATVRVLVEGPYGHTQPFHTFDHVLFVIGGSGIVVPLTYLSTLLASQKTQSIHIVWAVRELELARDIISHDFGSLINHDKLRLRVCVTDSSSAARCDYADLDSSIQIQHDRPDARHEVHAAAKMIGVDSLAVVSCGPPTMSDDTRSAVVDVLGQTEIDIEYFEESFRW